MNRADHVLKRDEADGAVAIGKARKRSSATGRRINAVIGSLAAFEASCRQIEKPRLGMNGNGWAGSIDKRRQHREDRLQELVLEPGHIAFDQHRGADDVDVFTARFCCRMASEACCSSCRPSISSRIWSSCSPGERPSGERLVMPSRTCPSRPATRTMKNSSRLAADIDRNRTRSSSGCADVERFLEHPAVELQPGELAVDEALGAGLQIFRRDICRDGINPQFTPACPLEIVHHSLQRPGYESHRL
jgi:hypothetical protein